MNKEGTFTNRLFQKSVTIGGCLALTASMFCMAPALGRADTSRPSGKKAAGIQSRLHRAGIYKHGKVKVQVKKGVATLKGTVDSYEEQEDAVHAARNETGVTKVVDNIQVNTQGIRPKQILKKARHQVLMYPYYSIFDHITLSANANDVLTLGGQVTQPYKKSDLGNILANIKGVAHLNNNLKVLPVSFMDEHVREEVAERIYGDPMFVNYGNQANPPIHIVVDNGNVTLYGVVNSKVDKQKAAIDARFSATYFDLENDLRVSS